MGITIRRNPRSRPEIPLLQVLPGNIPGSDTRNDKVRNFQWPLTPVAESLAVDARVSNTELPRGRNRSQKTRG